MFNLPKFRHLEKNSKRRRTFFRISGSQIVENKKRFIVHWIKKFKGQLQKNETAYSKEGRTIESTIHRKKG